MLIVPNFSCFASPCGLILIPVTVTCIMNNPFGKFMMQLRCGVLVMPTRWTQWAELCSLPPWAGCCSFIMLQPVFPAQVLISRVSLARDSSPALHLWVGIHTFPRMWRERASGFAESHFSPPWLLQLQSLLAFLRVSFKEIYIPTREL